MRAARSSSAPLVPEAVEEGLKGMKAGETKEISWTPEGEDAEEAAVEVTVKSIRARITPELTDELAKETFGFDSVEAMRDAVKLEIEQDKQSRLPGIKESRCVAALAERLELEEMDEDYEQSVFQELGQQFLSNLSARGMSLDQWLQANRLTSEQFISDLHHQADDVARESLALDALARELKIEVTDEDIDAEFERAAAWRTSRPRRPASSPRAACPPCATPSAAPRPATGSSRTPR